MTWAGAREMVPTAAAASNPNAIPIRPMQYAVFMMM
jgi:hypothetical protein